MPTLIETRHGRVLQLTLHDPASRNALHPDIYAQGTAALQRVAADDSLGAVVLDGAGGTFCSGGHIERLSANRERERAASAAGIEALHGWVRALRACPKPVLAAVEGAAAGAGFSLALACDLIVAARDARFSMAYVRIGLSPDGGGTAFLAALLPRPLAAELLLEGQPIGAERLHALGVVNRLAAAGEASAVALAYAARLASGPSEVQGRIKALLAAAPGHSLAQQLDAEREAFLDHLYGAACGEGLRAFRERRAPQFVQP